MSLITKNLKTPARSNLNLRSTMFQPHWTAVGKGYIDNRSVSGFEVLVIFIAALILICSLVLLIQVLSDGLITTVTLASLSQIWSKTNFASRNHRNHDNALMSIISLSLLLPPSNINLPMHSPFFFPFVNDSYGGHTHIRLSLGLQMKRQVNHRLMKRRVSAGERSWHHDKDDEYHCFVSNTLFHYTIHNLRTHSNLDCSTTGQSASVQNDLQILTGFSALLSVGIAFYRRQLLTTICQVTLLSTAHCPHLALSW